MVMNPDTVVPCASDPETWFSNRPKDIEKAREICNECPVRTQCGSEYLSLPKPISHWGIWGGINRDTAVEATNRKRATQ